MMELFQAPATSADTIIDNDFIRSGDQASIVTNFNYEFHSKKKTKEKKRIWI